MSFADLPSEEELRAAQLRGRNYTEPSVQELAEAAGVGHVFTAASRRAC